MKVYKASFKKKSGESRMMVFSKITELPEDFISKNIQGVGSEIKYPSGMELVWDLEADNFRIFNWNTLEGEVKESEMNDEVFK
tara:strand:- start:772 stop:1020 length:249 start_codon:yes stop_codon:yes gene_type:complete